MASEARALALRSLVWALAWQSLVMVALALRSLVWALALRSLVAALMLRLAVQVLALRSLVVWALVLQSLVAALVLQSLVAALALRLAQREGQLVELVPQSSVWLLGGPQSLWATGLGYPVPIVRQKPAAKAPDTLPARLPVPLPRA